MIDNDDVSEVAERLIVALEGAGLRCAIGGA